MIPFKVDQSWYETYWYGDASLRHAGKRRPIRLKSIAAAAALLAASGSGAALAQGLPPCRGRSKSRPLRRHRLAAPAIADPKAKKREALVEISSLAHPNPGQ